ncbi:hypothetical protein FB567DRAFT_136389 [Paraphoma chrysanthemicola]|uniref:BTB domain-containing protein n=1 Tax=Paraphoma chrysanthemicola TaxID=798071 RepID=A0A8K0QZG0_9PLEO|nr:hypothetical protein FB567DRAFT_136389 [Paraphoma chrysanthemicola]
MAVGDKADWNCLRPPALQPVQGRHMNFDRTEYNLKLSDPTADETLTVIVEDDSKTGIFHLPKTALAATSAFFARAAKPEWDAGSTRVFHLHDVDPAVFDLFARWLDSGAEILIAKDDWHAEYGEYMRWRGKVDAEKVQRPDCKETLPCPVTAWDFGLTTKAWFLGDYLESRDFQNHCLGHLYYSHLRFDHVQIPKDIFLDGLGDSVLYNGTVAFLKPDDIVYTWEMTQHMADESPFRNEQHPLRRFFVDWLEQYWDAYVVADFDYEAQDGIVRLIESCPDLAYKQLRNMSSTKHSRCWTVKDIGTYWIGLNDYSEEVQRRVAMCQTIHYGETCDLVTLSSARGFV